MVGATADVVCLVARMVAGGAGRLRHGGLVDRAAASGGPS